jgi:hypothetical protein
LMKGDAGGFDDVGGSVDGMLGLPVVGNVGVGVGGGVGDGD